VNYGRTAPGTHAAALGEKMRQETAQALEQALKHASLTTGLEGLVEKVAIAMKAPGMFQGLRNLGANVMGKVKPVLAAGALGLGAGALASTAYHNAKQDELQRSNPLVYSPMSGV
jgi:hypothetical protein